MNKIDVLEYRKLMFLKQGILAKHLEFCDEWVKLEGEGHQETYLNIIVYQQHTIWINV